MAGMTSGAGRCDAVDSRAEGFARGEASSVAAIINDGANASIMEEEQKTYICSPTGSWHLEQKLGEVSKQSAAIVK